ncbi:hypothetical protein N656DRAFT_423183 [Canariomyces notabilis]|uniref:Uncharacterized protein n=1 Tax=Canariomyces notabilis TaxID=2074819 RepID=A0AAN6QE25_9PEZI|nr:hypothetical protein N656DRAFT_423183 [Canariomyces arenarius]
MKRPPPIVHRSASISTTPGGQRQQLLNNVFVPLFAHSEPRRLSEGVPGIVVHSPIESNRLAVSEWVAMPDWANHAHWIIRSDYRVCRLNLPAQLRHLPDSRRPMESACTKRLVAPSCNRSPVNENPSHLEAHISQLVGKGKPEPRSGQDMLAGWICKAHGWPRNRDMGLDELWWCR